MAQREVLEKDWGRAIHERTTESLTTANNVDQTALVQRLEYTADVDATDLFDLRAADRLPVRDDRQRFECGARETRRTRRELRIAQRRPFATLEISRDAASEAA